MPWRSLTRASQPLNPALHSRLGRVPGNVLADVLARSGVTLPVCKAWDDAYRTMMNHPPLYATWLVACNRGEPQAALIRAVEHGKCEALAAILTFCPNLSLNEQLAAQALMTAVRMNYPDVVTLLLKHGVTPQFRHDEPLKVAAKEGKTEVVRALLQGYSDLRHLDQWPLNLAAFGGHTKVAALLLDAGADIHADQEGALRWAARAGHVGTVRLLLDRGADVHIGDESPLRIACIDGHVEVVKLMLQRGADAHASRDRPIREAVCAGRQQVVELLMHFDAQQVADAQVGAGAEAQQQRVAQGARAGVGPAGAGWAGMW